MYRESKRNVSPTPTTFLLVLSVAAFHYAAYVAKEMWRDMHTTGTIPGPDALHFMLKAVSRDPQVAYEVMRPFMTRALVRALRPGTRGWIGGVGMSSGTTSLHSLCGGSLNSFFTRETPIEGVLALVSGY